MENKAEQYYPTYKSKERDILLIEFEEAQKLANGQNKIYGQVTSFLLGIASFAFTFFLSPVGENKAQSASTIIQANSIALVIILFLFGLILLRYFINLQKQIIVNGRKVVTLRTMLGLDYGNIQLTIPNWTVEGATNPFILKYFNGWFYFKSLPFWLLTIILNGLWWFSTKDKTFHQFNLGSTAHFAFYWIYGYIIITFTYALAFRYFLRDRHETMYLYFVWSVCSILRIRLLDNFEYILYRAKLSFIELDRLKLEYSNLKKILIDIEDQTFKQHRGISIRSLARAVGSRFKYFRRKRGYISHGGSTITMQLCRTLFIPADQNKFKRKIAEILLSLWINKQFSKDEILKLYITSVRYERGVLGLAKAIKFFFNGKETKSLTNEEAFLLVERLSNITSSVNWQRVHHLIGRTDESINEEKLKSLYQVLLSSNKLKTNLKTDE